MEQYKKIIEGLLFIWGDPLSAKEIGLVLDLTRAEVNNFIQEMIEDYESADRGIAIRQIEEGYQLVTVKEIEPYISRLMKDYKKRSLTDSSLETLSIIAYKQPVTRLEVDSIRGVKSSSSVDTLVARGLIEEVGRLDQIGKPIVYGTTAKFLEYFNLTSLEELPSLAEQDTQLEQQLQLSFEDAMENRNAIE